MTRTRVGYVGDIFPDPSSKIDRAFSRITLATRVGTCIALIELSDFTHRSSTSTPNRDFDSAIQTRRDKHRYDGAFAATHNMKSTSLMGLPTELRTHPNRI